MDMVHAGSSIPVPAPGTNRAPPAASPDQQRYGPSYLPPPRKRVLDAMYEESKTLFANIFVNLSKKVLTNQEKCAAVFANSENGPCN